MVIKVKVRETRMEDRERSEQQIERNRWGIHTRAPFKHSSGLSLLLHSCCTANSTVISQLWAPQGKRLNGAVQSLADAKEGHSLYTDLPHDSFTWVEEEGFIKGLFHSITFDLVCPASTRAQAACPSLKEESIDKRGDGLNLWERIKSWVALSRRKTQRPNYEALRDANFFLKSPSKSQKQSEWLLFKNK